METTSWLYPLSLLIFLIIIAFNYSSKHNLPPSPRPKLPLLGHIHLLKFPLYRTYHHLSKKLGPIFSLQLGSRLVVVISSHTIVEECFTKNDVVLANRPRFIIAKYIGYNYVSLFAAPYSDYWRNLRRLTTMEIFSNSRLNLFQSIRHDEVALMLKKVYDNSCRDSGRVELRPLLSDLSFNNITMMVCGKRYFGVDESIDEHEAKDFREIKDEVLKSTGATIPADFFPVIRWIDYKDFEKSLKRLYGRMDVFLQGLIDEHRHGKGGNTMTDHLLTLQQSEPESYTDVIIKSLISDMLIAGTNSVSVTIEWTMSVLLNHPEKLEKAKAEIDNLVGDDRLVNESDLHNLPYLQNIITETMRLFPATPLLVPHEASADFKLAGYDIPRGTILFVNAWAIHRDPSIWDDPTTFKPERFEAAELTPPKLLPFGMGRRSCPGSGLTNRVIGLTIASLIQCFEWERVDGELVDLNERKGTLMNKKIPLVATCKPRLSLQNVLA